MIPARGYFGSRYFLLRLTRSFSDTDDLTALQLLPSCASARRFQGAAAPVQLGSGTDRGVVFSAPSIPIRTEQRAASASPN